MTNPSLKKQPPLRGESSSRSRSRPKRHLNLGAALFLILLLLTGGLGFFLIKNYQDHHQQSALLVQARQLLERKPPEPNLALSYLNRYLELNPRDLNVLDLKSKVLFELIRNYDQASQAIRVHEQVVLSDRMPKGKDGLRHLERPDARRRLVRLNLLVSKLQTAHTFARDLVGSDTRTAEDYRLLGSALMAMGANGVVTLKSTADSASTDSAETKDTGAEKSEKDTWEEAIKAYEEAQRRDPANTETARSLAYLYHSQRKDPKKALEVLDALLKNVQGEDEQVLARLVRYEYFASSDDKADKADAELKEALKLRPRDPNVLLQVAMNALRANRVEEARKYIDSIPPDQRSSERLRGVEGEIAVRQNKIDEAIQDWREGLKLTGGTSDALTWRLAYVLLRLGRPAEAKPLIDQYHRLTDRAQPTPKAVFLDGLLLLKQNNPKDAIEILEPIRLKAESVSSNQNAALGDDQSLGAEVALTLAQCHEALGHDQQALDLYRQSAKIVRGSQGLKLPDPWIGAATILIQQNRLDLAASELEDGLATMPDDPSLLINLSRLRIAQQAQLPKDRQDWSQVSRVLSRASNKAPNSVELIKVQVPFLANAGRLAEAEQLLAVATNPQHHPDSPELWALYADVLRRLDKADQALEVLDRGNKALGDQAVLWIARAQVLLSQGREKAAYDALTDGLKRVPPDQRPKILEALAGVQRRHNDTAAARATYAQWSKLDPQNPQPLLLTLDMALLVDDESTVNAAVKALEKMKGLPAEVALAMKELRGRAESVQDTKAREERLAKVETEINGIIANHPGKPIGYLLRGQLKELQGKPNEALTAYREARDHNGSPEAVRFLVALLARERKFDELRQLRSELVAGEMTFEIEQLAMQIALMTGDKVQAEKLLRDITRGNLQSLDAQIWKNRILTTLGKPKEAERNLTALIQQRPDELGPYVALMMLQLGQKQTDKAAETVEQIKANVRTEFPELVWAGCYLAVGNLPRATEYYKASLQKWPDDTEVLQRAVAFFRAGGHAEDAETALRQTLQRNPRHAWARRELAQLLSGRPTTWDEALKLIGTQPTPDDTAEDRLIRATVLARASDPARRQEAIPVLESLTADSPGAIRNMAHDLLARFYLDAGQLPKALEHAKALVDRSSDPNVIALYAELLIRAQQPVEAAQQVERLEKAESDSLRVLSLKAMLLRSQKKGEEAASLLEARYASLEKDNAPDAETMGRKILELLVGLGQLDAAERVGLRLGQHRPTSACAVARILAQRGKLEEALKQCQISADAGNSVEAGTTAAFLVSTMPPGDNPAARLKQADAVLTTALKQNPDHFGLLFAQTTVQRLQGRYTDAANAYRSMLARSPKNGAVLNNMAWTLSEDLDQPKEGLEKIDEAIQVMGRNPSLLDTRGVILTRMGKFDEAIHELETAAATGPSPAIYYHLARACHKAGQEAGCAKNRTLAKQAGLSASHLQPHEREEMDKLMNHH